VTHDTPDDWIPPAPGGEPLVDYLQRSIANHPRIARLRADCARYGLKPVPIPTLLFPAKHTVESWRKKWPERSYWLLDKPEDAASYRYKRALSEQAAVLFEELRPGGKLVAHAYRADDPETMRLVPPVLWGRPEMQINLQARDGMFRPETRRGQPAAVANLPAYFGLTLHVASHTQQKQRDERRKRVWKQWEDRRLKDRKWVSFRQLAALYDRDPRQKDEHKLEFLNGYGHLCHSIIENEFSVAGQSRVLFIGVTAWRMTREILTNSLPEMKNNEKYLIDVYLSNCWVPHKLASGWLETFDIHIPDNLLPAAHAAADAASASAPAATSLVQSGPDAAADAASASAPAATSLVQSRPDAAADAAPASVPPPASAEVFASALARSSPSPIGQADVASNPANWEALVKRHQGKNKVILALAAWIDKFGEEPPNRSRLLEAHRAEFGIVPGINELTMRKLRAHLRLIGRISVQLTRGGAPTHEKRRGR
jgi:hypothetical protein